VLRDERLRKRERLRLRSDFAKVFAQKHRAVDDVLVVYVAANGLAWSRLGLSVGKRVGGAVQRNYIRRRIREAFRRSKADLPGGLDIVCVAQPKAGERRYDIASSLGGLVLRAARAR
jgi:ribonuclease P protein component